VGRIFAQASARTAKRTADGTTLVLGGVELHDVRPLHSGRPTALTKAGRLSLRASTADGRAVKLTEMHTPEHAALLRMLAEDTLADILPPVLAVSGSVVVSSWIETQKEAHRVSAAELGHLAARIHATVPPTEPTGFDYFDDFLVPRARRAAATLGSESHLEPVLASAASSLRGQQPRVTHPDLTPDNVLRTVDGLVVIDNELFGVGRTPWLDVCNLTRALERADRNEATDAYRSAGADPLEPGALAVLRAMWLVRMVGSLHVAGRLTDIADLLEGGPKAVRLPFEPRDG